MHKIVFQIIALGIFACGLASAQNCTLTVNPITGKVECAATGAAGAAGPTGPTGSTGATGPAPTQSFAPQQNAGTDVICAKGADTITGITCNNASDATSATAFTTVATIPAGTLSSTSVSADFTFGSVTPAGIPTITISLFYGGSGGTEIYRSAATATTAGANASALKCTITAAGASGASTPLITGCVVTAPGGNGGTVRNVLLSNTTLSITADTTTSKTLVMKVTYSAATVGSAIWLYSMSPGSGGAVGPAGATGSLATNTETASNVAMAGPADCPSAYTITTGAWTYTPLAIPPTANCGVSIQNNSSSAGTIVTGGVTIINGQTANGTIPACLSAKDGCPSWILRANGSAGWDLSVAAATVTDSIWLPGAYWNQSLTIPGWSAGVNVTGSVFSPNRYGTMNYSLGAARASYLNYTLPSTWTGTITFKIWSTLAFSSSGTGLYYLGIYTSCVTMGTTNVYDGLTYNTVQSINHLFASTNYKTGALDSFTLTTTGCSAGSNLNIEILRDNSIFPLDVAVDDIQVMGVQLLVSHT